MSFNPFPEPGWKCVSHGTMTKMPKFWVIRLEEGHGETTLVMFYFNWATTWDLLNAEAQGAGQAVLRALPQASRVVLG